MDLIEFEKYFRSVARTLDDHFVSKFGRKIGFSLIVFEFYEPGIANCISNANRDDMISSLKETISILENGEDIPAAIQIKQ